MDRASAIEAATVYAGTLMPADPSPALDAALARSVLPDLAGRLPDAEGWVPTYDADWLAAEVVNDRLLAAMRSGTVTRWTSEGTTFESQPADLIGLVQTLRARSQIGRLTTNVLSYVDAWREGPAFRPRSDSWPYGQPDGIVGNWT